MRRSLGYLRAASAARRLCSGPKGTNSGAGGSKADSAAEGEEEPQLHPHWASLEQRILNRRTRNLGEGPVGRSGKRTWEEDFWLKEGLYDAARRDADEQKAPDDGADGPK